MSDDVYVGEDGWLFLTGGSNSPHLMYRRTIGHSWLLRRWARLLATRAKRARRLGIHYLHLTVPEKLSVYADKAPALGIDPSLGLGQRLARIVADSALCPDVVPPLVAMRGDVEPFMRTDSHWSSGGCKMTHDLVCREVGATLRWSLDERPAIVAQEFVGDLGTKLSPQPSEVLRRPNVQRDAVRVGANLLVERYERTAHALKLHRGTRVVLRNEAPDADPRRLVLFGDSYSHFSTHALTAMLAETFREVHFIWSTAIDWGYVEKVRPDILTTQIAERFMVALPNDDAYDNEAFAAQRMREMAEPAPA